jgi:hypothetical protein
VTVTNLGSFGPPEGEATRRAEITVCGQVIRVQDPGALPALEWADAVSEGLSTEDQRGVAAIYRMLRACVVNEDWQLFRQTVLDYRLSADTLLQIVAKVTAEFADRPTQPSSPSSPTSPTTATSSQPVSSTPVLTQGPDGWVTTSAPPGRNGWISAVEAHANAMAGQDSPG